MIPYVDAPDSSLLEDHASRYCVLRHVQKGAWGFVILALEFSSGLEFAIKLIERVPREGSSGRQIQQEITNHQRLFHPNIIEFKVRGASLTDSHDEVWDCGCRPIDADVLSNAACMLTRFCKSFAPCHYACMLL